MKVCQVQREHFFESVLEKKQHKNVSSFCSAVPCKPLSNPANGYNTPPASPGYRSVTRLSCNKGYKLSGSSTRTCLPDGTWDEQTTECKSESFLQF